MQWVDGEVLRRGHLAIPKHGHPEGHLARWCPGSGYLWMEHHVDRMLSAADSSSFITAEQQMSGGCVINFALPLSEISTINHLKLPARYIQQQPHDKSLLHSVPPLVAHIIFWAHHMFCEEKKWWAGKQSDRNSLQWLIKHDGSRWSNRQSTESMHKAFVNIFPPYFHWCVHPSVSGGCGRGPVLIMWMGVRNLNRLSEAFKCECNTDYLGTCGTLPTCLPCH